MNKNKESRNSLLAERVINGLKSRNMCGYYAEDKAEALKIALELIPRGASIGCGGSASVREIGLLDAVRSPEYIFLDREKCKTAEEKKELSIKSLGCDFYLSSTNAITEDGILVNIDGNCNRIAAIAYGPENILMIVGMNKVAKDLDNAISRARNIAAPINAQRFDIDTPCKRTGSCANCKSPDTICCQFLITRFSRQAGRIKVILVGEELGY